jgi:hypothetical protein
MEAKKLHSQLLKDVKIQEVSVRKKLLYVKAKLIGGDGSLVEEEGMDVLEVRLM